MSYTAPVKDMMFVLQELAGIDQVALLPGWQDAGAETAQAVLEECAKFNQEVIAPLNREGDIAPSWLKDGVVTTSKGFKQAYASFVTGGWQGLQHPEQFGGQSLPKLIATPCVEMLHAANLSFALCPLLTDGAIEALLLAGSDEQRALYAEKLVSGEWSGTMNLTEPQAGSDLSLVNSKAVPQGDGTYRISGQKIFITFGEHDMADNIIHLVLARTPDSPAGVKGISLFVVPKFLVNSDGSLGKRNDVWCSSIEHKLGIKASPTAVLLYGDNKGEVGAGAIGTLVGEENRGLEYMFIMMNAARFNVGMQGISVAERAYQKAVSYARDRLQSRAVEGSSAAVPIIRHPDVRRMLMTMRAHIEAARAMAYCAAATCDLAHNHTQADTRQVNAAFYEFMVPIVKGWSTEMSLEVTSLGVQVHGGMGFIEETGAAQYYRDARILPIYEGTTAIQANDLIGRKTARDGGKLALAIVAQARQTENALLVSENADLKAVGSRLKSGLNALESAIAFIAGNAKTDVRAVYAGSVPYLKLCGMVFAGWQMGRAALVAVEKMSSDEAFYSAKITTARFYADHILSQAPGVAASITEGAVGTLALADEQF